MIELHDNRLRFRFADVHEDAELDISFQRTLRIPDNGRDHFLPPGLGAFPLAHVDDHAERVPKAWLKHGGVMLPMYQSEAMWMLLGGYPCAVKVAAGKINAVTGETWREGLHRDPQDYMISDAQPWLDGFCVEKGVIRQFVAMPLGAGYSAEEQITGDAEYGGLQISVCPMKPEFMRQAGRVLRQVTLSIPGICCEDAEMGLAPGGRMRQEIFQDSRELDVWDQSQTLRCFVHIANSVSWRAITGDAPPTVPPTAKQYSDAGLPWFDYYDETSKALGGSSTLEKLKSVLEMGEEKRESPLPENESVQAVNLVVLRKGLAKNQVREGSF